MVKLSPVNPNLAAVAANTNMKPAIIQKTIVDNYFTHMQYYGYMNDNATMQSLFALLLLDSFTTFSEFVTDEFRTDVNKILRSLECCNCTVDLGDFITNVTEPFYQFTPTGVVYDTLEHSTVS